MKHFAVEVTFTFTGRVLVNAESAEQAKEITDTGFGLVIGNLHANDPRVKDWEFCTHPEKKTGEASLSAATPD